MNFIENFFYIPLYIDFDLSNILLISSIILMAIICLKLVMSDDLLESLIMMSIFSCLISICYLLMDAPDVAMTEAALGACLSSCVILNLIRIWGRKTRKIKKNRIIPALILCLVIALSLIWVAIDIEPFGQVDSPLQTHLSKYYLENTNQEIGIPSFVAAILASYRGFDTLGETSVIFIAGLAVMLILSRNPKHIPEDGKDVDTQPVIDNKKANLISKKNMEPLLSYIISFMVPYIILYSVYIQLNGEYSPGGGFQAGVIFASAIIAFDLITYEKNIIYKYFSNNNLLTIGALGVLLYALVGVVSIISNGTYLDYSALTDNKLTGQHLGIFIIELGVGITVSSMMCLIYFLLQPKSQKD